MGLPMFTICKGDAPNERGYHNEQSGLLPPSKTSVEETQKAPAQKEEQEQAGRQTEGLRQGRRQRYLVRALEWLPMEGRAPRLVRGLRKRCPRAFPEVEADGHLREADEEDGRVLRQRARRGRLEVASDGLQALRGSSGRRENGQEPYRQGQARDEDEPSRGWARSSHLGRAHRSKPPRQGLGRRSDRFDDTRAPGSQGATPVRRQSLRLGRLEGVRCLRGLHRSHQDQSQESRCRRRGAGASAYRGVCREGLSGQEGESGAHDFMVEQASQPPYSLVQEG